MRILIKILSFLLIFSSCLPFFAIFSAAKENENLSISASAFCLIDAESKRVLYGKNENVRMSMASTTKIMTAIIALESKIPLSSEVCIPKQAVGIEGSSIYLTEGEKISLEALLYGLLLSSANDAATAIAITVAGSEDAFVDLMNKKAISLGLENTHFKNPHGLYNAEHYSTAKDLSILMAYCMKNENFAFISGCSKKVFPSSDGGTRVMINHNKLLGYNVGVIAGKTGFTKKSGRCLISCAKRDELTLICATLDAPDDWNDHQKLYDFGFSHYKRANFSAIMLDIPLVSGNTQSVSVTSSDVSLLLPREYSEVEIVIEAPQFLFAGPSKGEEIGRVVYLYEDKILATSPLVLCENAPKAKYGFNPFEWLIDLFRKLKELLWKA